MAIHLIASTDEIKRVYTSIPSNGEGEGVFMEASHEIHGKLAAVLAAARVEDDLFFGQPEEKINRTALLEATTTTDSIQQSYELYAILEKFGRSSPSIRFRIQQVLGYMNNYDPYINIQGLSENKNEILNKHGNREGSTREERFAVSAAQAMDVLKFQKASEYKEGSKDGKKMLRAYENAHNAAQDFLNDSGSMETFNCMGFSLGEEFDDYQHPEEYPATARTSSLSSKCKEIAFITVHQAFETYFEEALRLLRTIRQHEDVEQVKADIKDITLLIDTANRYYKVMINLLLRPEFHAMRSSFGIASGAQSQRYHLIENHIGYPGNVQGKKMRHGALKNILGSKNIVAIQEEVPTGYSLKEHFSSRDDLAKDLKELNLALLDFKAKHGEAMLVYMDPEMVGSGGTQITQFFAKGMGIVFPNAFSEEEAQAITNAIKESMHNPEQEEIGRTDRFKAVKNVVAQIRKVK